MVHHILTIIAPIGAPPGAPSEPAPRTLDETIAAAEPALAKQFKQLPMVHFASIQAFSGNAPRPDACFQPCLVFESCIDGPITEYLDALVATDRGALVAVFGHCRGFAPGDRDPGEYLRAFLEEKQLLPRLYHIGNPDLRVDHIKAGYNLRRALDDELDAVVLRGRSLDPPQAIMEDVRLHANVPPSTRLHWHAEVRGHDPVSYAWFADPVSNFPARAWAWVRLGLLLAVPLAIGGGLLWLWFSRGLRPAAAATLGLAGAGWLLQRWWRGRNREPVRVDREAVNRLKELEDIDVQNHMASLLMLKEGWARRLSIRAVLYVFNAIYRTWYTDITPGRLQGLPTIHFAHWSLVKLVDRQGRQREGLLFLSNYDGSWETYLDDFLEYVFNGVVLIWANAVGFPWPLDGPTFKRWARGAMSPWQFCYRAYQDLTVLNIDNNDQIRKGLLRAPMTDAEARLWLARFGSIKRGNETLEPALGAVETHDIQGLVFSGYRRLVHAAYVLLRVDQAEPARRWLTNLVPRITDARERSKPEIEQQTLAYNVAFTWDGLRSLGLSETALGQFSEAFQEGAAPGGSSHRSRVLGDSGLNSPDHWKWGTGDRRADILLMIFAKRKEDLLAEVRAQINAFTCRKAGVEVTQLSGQLLLDDTDPPDAKLTREHFGFIDGISQPEIEGTARPLRKGTTDGADLLKPGEFLLGYTANDGTVTPGIPLEPVHDPHRTLPRVPDRPELRDFGRNGTYLVLRQLAQDVPAFRRCTAKAAGAADWETGSATAEQIAARMMGRWRDGTPLLAQASGAGAASPDALATANQFGFARDQHGFGCPIGSHIRRANPRDSLQPDSSVALNSANRHRLLRRGRPYGDPLPPGSARDDGQERGMAFICLNSDIERQFEFVQQNWINNPSFGGLYAERDPVMGTVTGSGGSLTVQANAVRERMNGFGQFVTVKGGDYFFLPGMSALRYLSSLDGTLRLPAGQVPARLPAPAPPPPQRANALRRALTGIEGQLRTVRSLWSARYPVLLAAALVALAIAPARVPAVALSLFVTDRVGTAVVSALASLTAFVVMTTLRLAIMYGWRSVKGRARWTRPANWWQVFAFQLLALPVVVATLHYSARDLAAGSAAIGYWGAIGHLLPAAFVGLLTAVAMMAVVTALQALRPDSGAGLFFPPTVLARMAGAPGWRPRRLWQLSGRFSRLARWIIDSVPHDLGYGYIDYRHRRILPGHVFALSFALAIAVAYGLGAVALSPARCASGDWLPATVSNLLCAVSPRVPPLAYLLFLFIAVGWLLAGASFFLDRYRVATVLVLGVWLALIGSFARTDHVFEVGPITPTAALTPSQIVRAAREHQQATRVIVVAAEGLGLASSAWTAQVLGELARLDGFASSLRLVSAVSGAALGSVYFIDTLHQPGGDAHVPPLDANDIEALSTRARRPSSSQLGWGLAYPDFARTFVPWLVRPLPDRGWAMEQAWSRTSPGTAATKPAMLSEWRSGVAAGWRPAVAFGVTIVETGGRSLLATYDPPGKLPDVTRGHDLSVFTAARLSAAFPFVSPVARADVDEPAYHLADGGYWDNSGLVSALEWLESASPELVNAPVMLIEIVSSTPPAPRDPEDNAWTFDLTGPLRTMLGVRYDAQPARNTFEAEMFADRWRATSGRPLRRARFALDVKEAPLTWNLGQADTRRISEAWRRDEIQKQTAAVRQFLRE
jgi:Dyp-type peroxidase family